MKKIIFIAVGFLALSFLSPKTVFGIGQVTEPIVIENALRGQEVTATLTFINSKDTEITYGLMAEGDIAEWTTFYSVDDLDFVNPTKEIKISSAKTQNAIAKFTVPPDQPNGTYTGKVYVFDAPKNGSETDINQINVGQRIGRNVSITVSETEITKLESSIIPLTYEVKKNEPLQIKFIHTNQGNIAVKPSYQIRASKNGKEVFNAIFPYPESEKAIKPLERKIMPLVEWQTTGLEDGVYLIEIKVLLKDEVVKKINHTLIVGNYVKPIIKNKDIFLGITQAIGNDAIKFALLFIVALIGIMLLLKKSKKIKFKKNEVTMDSDEI